MRILQKTTTFALAFGIQSKYGDSLAQLVEHNTFNVGVMGSSPMRVTILKKTSKILEVFFVLSSFYFSDTDLLPFIYIRFGFHLILYIIRQFREEIVASNSLYFIDRIDKVCLFPSFLRLVSTDKANSLRIIPHT